MTEKKEVRLAREIYAAVGGPANVAKLIHCMTRVRMTIRDDDQVDMTALKAIDGVLGVVEEDTLQVVVGPGIVNKVAKSWSTKSVLNLVNPSQKISPQLPQPQQ